ncbi:MFS transporter [Bacillus sp. S14(2024)]|uniref:MFS transporter n=1 Tax=Bacillus sp. S14(2024) TaxID=3162884 RepID=UPI003D199D1A
MEQNVALHKIVTQKSVMTNPKFLFLWAASTFTGLAFSIYLITESWYVVQQLDRASLLGIVMMMTTIPRVLLMAFGGVMADRFKRSLILFTLNMIRGGIILVLVLLLWNHQLNISWLIGFAFFFGILDAFFWPSSNSLIPNIVAKQQITRANSMIQTTNQISLMMGPALAALIMKFGSFTASFATAAGLLIISGILAKLVKEKPVEHSKKQRSFTQDLKEGITYVKGFPYLLTVMFTSIFVNFFLVGPMNIGLPLLVKNSLKGDVLDLSYLESSLAIGMTAGAILTGIIGFRKKRAVISLSLVSILGIGSALLSQMTTLWYGIIIISILGICLSISNIISPSLTQELVEPSMMGRVQSLMSTASMGFTPLSFAIVSVLLSFGISISFIMLVSCIVLTLFVWIVLWKVRIVWKVD